MRTLVNIFSVFGSIDVVILVSLAKENFVTVFNSRDGTLRLTQENARALGIGISSNDGKNFLF